MDVSTVVHQLVMRMLNISMLCIHTTRCCVPDIQDSVLLSLGPDQTSIGQISSSGGSRTYRSFRGTEILYSR